MSTHAPTPPSIAELQQRALYASEHGQWDDALSLARSAVEQGPNEALSHKRLALALWFTGQHPEALASLRRCLELDPGFSSGHYNLACFQAQMGQRAEALGSLQRAIELQDAAGPTFAASYRVQASGDADLAPLHDDEGFLALCAPTRGALDAQRRLLAEGDLQAVTGVLQSIGRDLRLEDISWTGDEEEDRLTLDAALERTGADLSVATLAHLLGALLRAEDLEENRVFEVVVQHLRAGAPAQCDALLCDGWVARYAGLDAGHLGSFDQQVIAALADCAPALAARALLTCMKSQPGACDDFPGAVATVLERLATVGPPELLAEVVDVYDRHLHAEAYVAEPLERRRARVALALPPPPVVVPPSDDHWAREKTCLAHWHPGVAIPAARSLIRQAHQPELPALVQPQAPRLLAWALDPALPAELRLLAVEVLVKLGTREALAPIFEEALAGLFEATARLVYRATGLRVTSAAAVTSLLARAEAPGDWSPQYAAVVALRYFEDARVVPGLVAALAHAQGAVRREAAYGLGVQGDPAAVPSLVNQLRVGNEQMVVAASRALAALGTPEAVAALSDEANYQQTLAHCTGRGARFAAAAPEHFRLPRVGADLLRLALQSDDDEARQHALDSLARLGHVPALAPLVEFLGDRFRGDGHERSVVPALRRIVGVQPGLDRAASEAVARVLSGARSQDLQSLLERVPPPEAGDPVVAQRFDSDLQPQALRTASPEQHAEACRIFTAAVVGQLATPAQQEAAQRLFAPA